MKKLGILHPFMLLFALVACSAGNVQTRTPIASTNQTSITTTTAVTGAATISVATNTTGADPPGFDPSA